MIMFTVGASLCLIPNENKTRPLEIFSYSFIIDDIKLEITKAL